VDNNYLDLGMNKSGFVHTLCWGSGPAHVRVSGPLCGLEEFLVNTASTRGSEENNHQGFGGKSPSTPSLYI
jgi:hypothetical protein